MIWEVMPHPPVFCHHCGVPRLAGYTYTDDRGSAYSAGIVDGEIWIVSHGPESEAKQSKGLPDCLGCPYPWEGMSVDAKRWLHDVVMAAAIRSKDQGE